MKRLLPFVAAMLVTGTLACGALVVGVAAAVNPNGVRAADSPPAIVPQANATAGQAADQIAQLQALIQQYQDRESQYRDQLSQAQAAIDNYQQILTELQQVGVLRITSDGRILVRGPEGRDDDGG
jgi:predicted PurR-regulated permease PerM